MSMSKGKYKATIAGSKNPGAAKAAIAKNARKKLGKSEFQRRAKAGKVRGRKRA